MDSTPLSVASTASDVPVGQPDTTTSQLLHLLGTPTLSTPSIAERPWDTSPGQPPKRGRAEQDSKKARQVVEALLPALRDRIRLQRDEATVVVDGRALLRVRPVSASETSVLEFVPAALQRVGLDRSVVEAAFLARAGRRSFRTEEWI